MAKMNVLDGASRVFHKLKFNVGKHSPELLSVAGTVSVVAGAVMECKASTKLEGVMAEAKEKVDTIKAAPTNPELKDQYTEEDAKKDVAIVYAYLLIFVNFHLIRMGNAFI